MSTLGARIRSILLLIAAPAILLVVVQTLLDRHAILKERRADALLIADRLSEKQEKTVADAETFLKQLVQLPAVQDPAREECTRFLQSILPFATDYSNLGVPSASGDLRCNALPLDMPVNVADRLYFQQALTERRFAISSVQHDRATKIPSVNFAYPLAPASTAEHPPGVVVAVMSLRHWNEQLNTRDMPLGSVAFVLDSLGQLVARYPPNLSQLGMSPAELGLSIPDQLGIGDTLVQQDQDTRRLYYRKALFSENSGGSLDVVIGIPLDSALAAANWQAMRSIGILTLAGLIIWFTVHQIAQHAILRPLNSLTRSVGQVASYDHFHEPPSAKPTGTVEEFAFLSTRFAREQHSRRAAELAERQRREELEAVLDALPDIYFRIDHDQTIVDYHAHDMTDLLMPPEQFMGKRMSDLLPPDAAQKFERHIQTHHVTREVVTWTYELDLGDGVQTFEARACAISGGDETVLVIRNITARARAEDAMRLSTVVYDSSSEGMVVTNEKMEILTVNPAFRTLVGASSSLLMHVDFPSLVHKTSRQSTVAGFRQARANGGWDGEIEILGHDNTSIPVWLSINASHKPDGTLSRYVILARDMTDQKRANETIWFQAHYDALTGLLNRAALCETLDEKIQHAQKGGKDVVVLFLDLDGLKQINDRLGHAAGDQMLSLVAKRLRNQGGTGLDIARYGGDEFVVVLNGAQARKVDDIASSLLADIARPYDLDGEKVHLTASLGIARYPTDADTSGTLLSAADQAMYVAKSTGRNRATPFSPDIQRAATEKLNMISDLHKAVHNGDFDVHFQPIVDLRSGQITKAEALLRWQHGDHGNIPPDQFIPLAEEIRLIEPLGELVFHECHKALPKLQKKFGQAFQICINVSPMQLNEHMAALKSWTDNLQRNGLSGSNFVIEITESALLDDGGPMAERLASFQAAGLQLALDDFGTGYSSLSYFLKHKIDFLKIDRKFIRDLPENAKAETLCKIILDMAHKMNVQVIAEGIETPEQQEFVTTFGADFGQGFLLSRPMPLKRLLQSSVTSGQIEVPA
ncbi:bifunctional diguanylate cyclase/phosphodiesterase [Aliiroseovarius crassostreae]|uniref:bifunctional diguanylate cyclase/phosphodiesterase n=1 Tax=Aliiroseovarius crassostreae TaxID=154981 RepID=UPI003C7A1BBA